MFADARQQLRRVHLAVRAAVERDLQSASRCRGSSISRTASAASSTTAAVRRISCVGTGKAAVWDIKNGKTPTAETAFSVRAKAEGIAGNNLTVDVQLASATGSGGAAAATGTATVSAVNGVKVTVNSASPFRVGDTVTRGVTPEVFTNRAKIVKIDTAANVIELANALAGLGNGDAIRIASILPTQSDSGSPARRHRRRHDRKADGRRWDAPGTHG
jgi:hypothetical protein